MTDNHHKYIKTIVSTLYLTLLANKNVHSVQRENLHRLFDAVNGDQTSTSSKIDKILSNQCSSLGSQRVQRDIGSKGSGSRQVLQDGQTLSLIRRIKSNLVQEASQDRRRHLVNISSRCNHRH